MKDIFTDTLFHTATNPDHELMNSSLLAEFESMKESQYTHKSHFFHGRYENIYIDSNDMPTMSRLTSWIITWVAGMLGCSADKLKLGYWLNIMSPGDVTTLHSHDDDNELVSGVYYITVPDDSGNLVFQAGSTEELKPEVGMLVIFSPQTKHEVRENKSNEIRLSIGFNIGPSE